VQAQSLPPPSRTVYKCIVAKKVVYTDEPCVGAQVVDVEPSRGLNKSTGRELTGSDVARERRNEAFAEAAMPITGMSEEQLSVYRRRMKLDPNTKAECSDLDRRISQDEAEERVLSAESKTLVQRRLFEVRKRHRTLQC